MRDYFKPKTWLITILMYIIAVGFSSVLVYFEFGSKENIKNTSASQTKNVSGWAWNSNIGWISFNCDHTADGTLPPANTNTCGDANYGVDISVTKIFSGYAWSSSVGWISFNRCGTDDDCSTPLDGDTGNPPSDPYQSGSGAIAKLNQGTGKVEGWAKILSMGDNGWIKLNGSWTNGVAIGATGAPTVINMTAPNWNYTEASADALRANLQFSSGSSSGTGNFSGYAWNANDDGSGIGWISFNSTNCDSDSNGFVDISCGGDNSTMNVFSYKVVGAGIGGSSSNLNYRIIVNNSDSTNNPVFDSGQCIDYNTPEANPIKCKMGISGISFPLGAADGLNYDTPYYWWVKFWDGNGNGNNVSWTQYDTNSDTDNNDSVRKTFTTYKHEFPRPLASHFILNPSRKEEVKFIANDSKRFTMDSKSTPVPCTNASCAWNWDLSGAPGAVFKVGYTAAASTTIIIFNSAGDKQIVTLTVTDQGDTGSTPYYSKKTIEIDVGAKLPRWKEVKPE